jgi:hypothetical protein
VGTDRLELAVFRIRLVLTFVHILVVVVFAVETGAEMALRNRPALNVVQILVVVVAVKMGR